MVRCTWEPPPAVTLRRVNLWAQKILLLSIAVKSLLTPTMMEKSHLAHSLASPSMSRGLVMSTMFAANCVKESVAVREKMW